MKITRPSRAIGAILALLSMLFMQFVLAGYVCPKASVDLPVGSVTVSTATPMAMAEMADCDHVDVVQPTLCHVSAHAVHQSLDKHEPPAVQPFVAAAMVHVLVHATVPTPPDSFALNTARLSGASPPSLAIRHCCFRI